MRTFTEFELNTVEAFTDKLLRWSARYDHVSYLNSNSKSDQGSYNLIVAVNAIDVLNFGPDSFNELKKFTDRKKDWLFGHFSYDLKNQTEQLFSVNFDGLKFSDIFFFQPEYVFLLKGNKLQIGYLDGHCTDKKIKELFNDISSCAVPSYSPHIETEVKSRISKDEYLDKINAIKNHISRGDIYEMNFCFEFFAEEAEINPVEMYTRLNAISETPFSAFYKLKNKYLLSASPERFLKKTGTRLLSQPIKGTVKRGENNLKDEKLKDQLLHDEKERNENVMIVDLVRNDLSRSAVRGSVKVDELFGIYTFKQVHQMISSVSAELRPDVHFVDAIKNAFPMGSMTGAPKVKAMELIEEYESTKRSLYSGAVGYITPDGDFDFNVVIRSILYNSVDNYLSFMAGSAITSGSDPEKEYAECLLKAKAMMEVLSPDCIAQ